VLLADGGGANADAHRAFGSIPAQYENVEIISQGAGMRALLKSIAELQQAFPDMWCNQLFHPLVGKLSATIATEGLGLGARLRNSAPGISDQDGIGVAFEQLHVLFLR
jgi:hypothetical protein